MVYIETLRLKLRPLAYFELELLSQSRQALEEKLGLTPSDFKLNASDDFLEEFHQMIPEWIMPKVAEHPADFCWVTHWLILEKQTNLTVGGIGARGLTDEHGQNMIGYFIDQKSEGKGYATEAAQAFTAWMFKQDPNLREILADTLVDGVASQKVLQKARFVASGTTDEGLRWHLKRPG